MDNITQVRVGVFETNSSSSHAVIIGGEAAQDFGLSKDILRAGFVDVDVSDFTQRVGDIDRDTIIKLAALLSVCVDSLHDEDGRNHTVEGFRKTDNGKRVLDIFETLTGVKVRSVNISTYLETEHNFRQVCEDAELIPIFLFSKDSGIQFEYD